MKSSNANDPLAYVADLPGFKPNQPAYFDNEVIDHLLGIVLDLGAEFWVMKDRMAFLEETLAENGIDVTATLDTGHPSNALQARLKEERLHMIQRVYGRLYSRYGGDEAEQRAAIVQNLDAAEG